MTTKLVAQRRFDGFQTWDKQLKEWSEEVSTYLTETESQLNELLQPKESSSYDMSNFGVSSDTLRNLTRSEDEDDIFSPKQQQQQQQHDDGSSVKTKSSSSLSERLGIDTTTTPPIPPITLAALDRNLPPIPKPRAVTPDDEILPHTDISDKSKNIWIVTTASLPWMTGTAVNPLLRAAYLSTGRKAAGGSVTLMLPWVERTEDKKRIYGDEKLFETPEDQEEFVRSWLRDTANMKEASVDLNIRWYTAWQEVLENSLYSMGDIIGLIPQEKCDICVLEEPEHLNWYRAPGENWTSKFKHVVGIVHTNYFVYATEQPAAFIRAPGMKLLASWMCRAHCHRLIKLSGTLGQFAPEKELVENVHGVRRTFIDIGEELRGKLTAPDADKDPIFSADATPAVYFIGKMLWSKGLGSLMELIKYAEESAGLKVKVDMYGGGPNKDEASAKAQSMGLDMPFHGPIDHAELGWTQKVFINPSTSEVLCTTVAEALAMGKFVVLPSHPSNDFFCQFPNCLPYSNKEEFVGNLYYALTHAPEPMSEEYSYALSWEAATERFAAAGSVSVAEAEAMEEALSSTDAGIDITLPPVKINEERKKLISRSFRKTRGRYRNFRTRLSQEITKSIVLPKEVQHRLIAELDKRLDVDLDELLDSPKLRVKLSPAKLDKLLLELYNSVTEGPRGDVFRVIGGGANVGRQHLYLKQQEAKSDTHQKPKTPPYFLDATVLNKSSPTSLVKKALNRNLPYQGKKIDDDNTVASSTKEENIPKMSVSSHTHRPRQAPSSWGVRLVRHGSFTHSRPSQSRYVPLI
jgi:digalactosyldiacylglycerol synthase